MKGQTSFGASSMVRGNSAASCRKRDHLAMEKWRLPGHRVWSNTDEAWTVFGLEMLSWGTSRGIPMDPHSL